MVLRTISLTFNFVSLSILSLALLHNHPKIECFQFNLLKLLLKKRRLQNRPPLYCKYYRKEWCVNKLFLLQKFLKRFWEKNKPELENR